MLKVKLRCQNTKPDKVAKCLSKFSKRYPLNYKVEVTNSVSSCSFEIKSMSLLNEILRRLRHIRDINIEYEIEKVSNNEH